MSDCARCGKPLSPDVRFCPYCGREAPPPAVDPLTGGIGMVKAGQDVHIGVTSASSIRRRPADRHIRLPGRMRPADPVPGSLRRTIQSVERGGGQLLLVRTYQQVRRCRDPLPPVPLILSL